MPNILGFFWIDSPNLSQKDPFLGKLGQVINPLTPGAFAKNALYGHFGGFQAAFRPN